MIIYSRYVDISQKWSDTMKILLNFLLQQPEIPLDYRGIILSFIKKALSSIADEKYYDKYYKKKERRPFTFAVNLPKAKFSQDKIILGENKIKLILSTGDDLAGFVFMSAFLAMKDKQFPLQNQNSMTLKAVSQLKEKTVAGSSAMVKMLSPLCLREHNSAENSDLYYSVKSDKFDIKAKEIITEQLLLEGFLKEFAENADLKPINCKKTVVKHYGCCIECSLGEFVITADKSVINYFLKYGIGSRKSAGFGFAELIAEV